MVIGYQNRLKSKGLYIFNISKKSCFSFPKKTVLAVLDRLIEPLWPYLPDKTVVLGENCDRLERVCSSILEDPLIYNFWYHLLEADDQGRQPKLDENTVNEMFNTKSVSCLRRIAESEDKVEFKLSDMCVEK